MRTLAIFLSISVFLTWIHCSNGAPRKIRFLAPDELQVFMEKFSNDGDENSVSESHESGEEEEEENEKKIVDTNDPNSKSSEEVNLDEDSEAILPPLINIHHKQIPEDNEED